MSFFQTEIKKTTQIISPKPAVINPASGKHPKNIRTFLLYMSSFIIAGLCLFAFYFFFVKGSEAAWFNDEFHYRQVFTFTHNAVITTERAITFSLDTAELIAAGVMQADCDDTRFTDVSGNLLRYQLTGTCDNAATTYEVVFPSITNGTNSGYVYYGNPAAISASVDVSGVTALTPFGGDPAITTRTSEVKGPSPVLYWKFNDGHDTTAQDSTSQNNDGTVNGPTWEPGGVAANTGEFSLKFDGSNDLVSKSYSSDSELDAGSANMTVSVWARHSSTVPGAGTTDVIIARYSSGGYKVYINENGYLCFGVDDDASWGPDFSACSAAGQGSFADSKWHHIEGVKDASSTITLYIDGRKVTQTSLTAFGSISGSSPAFYAGIDSDGTSNPWTGYIDDVKIYTSEQSARTGAQVNSDYVAHGSFHGSSVVLGEDVANTNLVNGLVGWWKMDESSGNAADSSGNATTLTNNSTTPFTGAKFANGAELDGSTDYFDVADNAVLSLTGSITLSAWIIPDIITGTHTIIGKYDSSNQSYLLTQEADEIRMYIDSSANYQTTTATNLAANSTYLVTGVYNSVTGTVRLFVNGTEQTSTTSGTIPTSIVDDGGKFSIGANDTSGTPANYFDGHIDDARIYNRALSPAEVSQLYNWAPGPRGYWKMDENSGTSVFDSSGNSYTGTMTGLTAASWIPGKLGSALNFDGSGDYVDVSSVSSISNTTYSISVWFKIDDFSQQYNQVLHAYYQDNNSERIRLELENDGTLRMYDDYNLATLTSVGAVSANTWYHVEFTWNYTNQIAILYLNGIAVSTDTSFTQPAASTVASATIGYRNGSSTYDWDGIIDDLKIYEYVRTPAQIIEDMNAGHSAPGSPVGSSVANWKFDEGALNTCSGSINDFCDTSVNANDLAFSTTSGGYTNDGKYRRAFNGTGAVWAAQSADDSDFDFAATEDFTLSLWFRSDSGTNPASGADQFLIGKGTITNTGTVGYTVYADDNGKINFGIRSTSGAWGASSPGTPSPEDFAVSTTDLYDGSWHHLAATKTGTSRIDLYVDGKSNASDTSLTASATLANSIVLRLADDDSDATNSFAGDLDEVEIFRSVLTADQVKILYNQKSASVWGSLSTNASGTASWSNQRGYCPPGNTETNCGSGDPSPILQVPFDDNTGTSVKEISGSGLTSTVGGNTAWKPGKFGSSYYFDGASDDVNYLHSTLFDFSTSTPFTLQGWFKLSENSSDQDLIVRSGADTDKAGFNVWLNNSGDISANIRTATPSVLNCRIDSGVNGLEDDSWHFISVVYNRNASCTTSDILLYFDGIRDAGTSVGVASGNTNQDVAVTGVQISTSNTSIKGQADEVRIYNYARTPAQIAWDYNRGKPVAHWKMDEASWNGTASEVKDSSGNSLHGTRVGNATTATGKINNAGTFDGSGDRVTLPDYDILNQISISAWIKPTTVSSDYGIISKRTPTEASGDWTLRFANDLSGKLDFMTWNGAGGSDISTSDTVISTTEWSHVVATYDSVTNIVKFYLNGKPDGTRSNHFYDLADNPEIIQIGFDGQSGEYTGLIDDVRLYNYVLSDSQVKTIMNEDSAVRYGPVTGTP